MLEFNYKTVKQPCEPVTWPALGLPGIATAMWEVLDHHGGVGLAANQVGFTVQIILVNFAGSRLTIANPVITKKRGGTCMEYEECLSWPGQRVKLARFKIVEVEGRNLDNSPFKIKARGTLARILQHEIDHMNGISIFRRKSLGLYGEINHAVV